LQTVDRLRDNRLSIVIARASMAEPALRSSLRERIKDLMLQRIVAGEYAPGERLVETRIAQELGVSQASVREALRDLEHIGCVSYEPYRGCSVRTFSTDELLEAFPVRAALESLAAQLAAEQMTAAELAELAELYEEILAAARRGEPHKQSRADAAFHGAIARGTRNATLERQWTYLEPYARTFITLSRPGADLVELAEEHLPILDALRAGDGKRAGKAMHRHLMHAGKALASSA
jgi:DNA-binding GntR family transcriptional regulator